MFRSSLALLALALSLPAQNLALPRLFSRPLLWGTWPSQVQWSKNSHILGFLWNASGGSFRDLYVYNADTKKLLRLTDLENLKDPLNDNEAEHDPHRRNYLPPLSGLASFDLSNDGAQAVFSYRGDLFLTSTAAPKLKRLTKTKAPETNPELAPDGTRLAYNSGGQIMLLNLPDGSVEQRTDIRAPAALTDFSWSPDGKSIAYATRSGPGRTMPLPNYSGQFIAAPAFSRDVAGDAPIALQHYVVDTTGDNPPRLLDTGKAFGFRPPKWSDDSRHLLLVTEAANFKSQDILIIDLNTGKSHSVYHQTDDRWVESADAGWDPASKHIWFVSDQSGFQHLYSVALDGANLRQITRGNWDIHNDPFSNRPQWIGDFLYYSSTQKSTSERQFYRVGVNGSAQPEQLSRLEGLNIGYVSEDGKEQALLQADLKNPFDLYVNGSRVTQSPLPEFYKMPWAESRFVSFPSLQDKQPVAGRLLLPPGYNPDDPKAKPRPAIVYIHGAGYATSVLKQWGSYQELRFAFNNYLANQGYPVLEMDYRGSTNYGRDWRSGVYLNMGGPDLEDVLGGVEYLRGLKNIDMARIGIWGWSYGGFMTSMAMFRAPAVFQAGAAFSGVYDWANYNRSYTEQRLTTPAENPEAYERSSPIHFSRQLRNHLLIVHGMADNNVLFQDAVQLSEKLIHEGKPFDEIFYPEESHGYVRDETLQDAFGRTAAYFDRYLRAK